MRKIAIWALLALMAVAIAAVPALAQGEHFTRQGFPSCTISGTTASAERTITCTGELAGLGNEDLSTTTLAEGSVTFFCGSPGSGNLAPGQNKFPAQIDSEEPTVVPGPAIKNGRATATDFAILSAPTDVTPEEAGCQNRNWQVVGSGLAITSVTYTVEQGDTLLATCTRSGTSLSGTFTFTRNQCSGPAVR